MIILIVTPTRNVEKFLDETIFNILSQAGDFKLHYHIQDSQSTDGTIDIIKKWEHILNTSETPFQKSKISFSWVSESDQGMYDAINRGFAYLTEKVQVVNPNQVVMTWINGDDILTPGAIQTVVQFFSASEYQWLTGVASLIRNDSAFMDLRDSPWGFSKSFLKQGLYDGRYFDFVQQEGTFWRQSLWQVAGPLDSTLKLAGDWDLWRRFANHSELLTLRAVLGLHRRRRGQLSSSLEAYYQEVDAVLQEHNLGAVSLDPIEQQHYALTARWNNELAKWQIDTQETVFSLQADLSLRLSQHTESRSNLAQALDSLESALRKSETLLRFSSGKSAVRDGENQPE
ncbi:glycosyltransferase [bacterium]|nr:glycosyltransferase [bacterium]